MNVVFDTNVLIPIALRSSRSALLLELLTRAGHNVVLSPDLYEEVRDKLLNKPSLRKWLMITDDEIQRFLERLPTLCLQVPGNVEVKGSVPDDPDDDKVLATAWEGHAEYIVTEDVHLLKLGVWNGIRIVTRATLLTELGEL